jgi:hypothetical protein
MKMREKSGALILVPLFSLLLPDWFDGYDGKCTKHRRHYASEVSAASTNFTFGRMELVDPLAHASIGLMAKSIAPGAPLWALVAATQVPDLLCFGFFATGIESPGVSTMDFSRGLEVSSLPFYPWSHGLAMSIVWSLVVPAIAFLFSRDRRTSLVIGAMVLSHWVLDFSVYSTLPVFFDHSLMVGLGLLNSGPGVIVGIVLEVVLIAGGIALYLVHGRRAATRARVRNLNGV